MLEYLFPSNLDPLFSFVEGASCRTFLRRLSAPFFKPALASIGNASTREPSTRPISPFRTARFAFCLGQGVSGNLQRLQQLVIIVAEEKLILSKSGSTPHSAKGLQRCSWLVSRNCIPARSTCDGLFLLTGNTTIDSPTSESPLPRSRSGW